MIPSFVPESELEGALYCLSVLEGMMLIYAHGMAGTTQGR